MKDYYIFQHCKLDADEHVMCIEGGMIMRVVPVRLRGIEISIGTPVIDK